MDTLLATTAAFAHVARIPGIALQMAVTRCLCMAADAQNDEVRSGVIPLLPVVVMDVEVSLHVRC